MIYYLILSVLLAGSAFAATTRRAVNAAGALFYAVQAAFAVWILTGGRFGSASGGFFTYDALGTVFFVLLAVVSLFVFIHSEVYFRDEDIRLYRRYFSLLMLLTTAIAGVYFADNIAVTWIFLEATTLCSAGIIYHRRTAQALEATWKYVFVCSTGIATAYLGILLLCSAADGSLAYSSLAERVASGNPLYMKTAFLMVLCGYSCKMEILPRYP
ncbi:MAG: hydrogenase 4 subunit F, partial [Alistipes sp.]|nr:hydrogenase 4 subunit F [Alistipes sp.]